MRVRLPHSVSLCSVQTTRFKTGFAASIRVPDFRVDHDSQGWRDTSDPVPTKRLPARNHLSRKLRAHTSERAAKLVGHSDWLGIKLALLGFCMGGLGALFFAWLW